eukprot:scaffold92122_cov64-Phaeocystis_antarctica.AAC.2
MFLVLALGLESGRERSLATREPGLSWLDTASAQPNPFRRLSVARRGRTRRSPCRSLTRSTSVSHQHQHPNQRTALRRNGGSRSDELNLRPHRRRWERRD